MSHAVPEAARALAAQLERQFGRDAELARRLADAQRRLARGNDRLWWGLHPDGLAAVYEEHPAPVDVAFAANRSEVLGAANPLAAIQDAHRRIHSAFIRLPDRRRGAPSARRRGRRANPPIRRRAPSGRMDREPSTQPKASTSSQQQPSNRTRIEDGHNAHTAVTSDTHTRTRRSPRSARRTECAPAERQPRRIHGRSTLAQRSIEDDTTSNAACHALKPPTPRR